MYSQYFIGSDLNICFNLFWQIALIWISMNIINYTCANWGIQNALWISLDLSTHLKCAIFTTSRNYGPWWMMDTLLGLRHMWTETHLNAPLCLAFVYALDILFHCIHVIDWQHGLMNPLKSLLIQRIILIHGSIESGYWVYSHDRPWFTMLLLFVNTFVC